MPIRLIKCLLVLVSVEMVMLFGKLALVEKPRHLSPSIGLTDVDSKLGAGKLGKSSDVLPGRKGTRGLENRDACAGVCVC